MTVEIEEINNLIEDFKERQRRISLNKLELLNIHDFKSFEKLRSKIFRNLYDLDGLIEASLESIEALWKLAFTSNNKMSFENAKTSEVNINNTMKNINQTEPEGVNHNFLYLSQAHEESKDRSEQSSICSNLGKIKLNFNYADFRRGLECKHDINEKSKHADLVNQKLHFDYSAPKEINLEPKSLQRNNSVIESPQELGSLFNSPQVQIERSSVITELIIEITKNRDLHTYLKRNDDKVMEKLLDPNISNEIIRDVQNRVENYFNDIHNEESRMRNEAFTLGKSEYEPTLGPNDRANYISNQGFIEANNSHIVANSKLKTSTSRTHSNSKINKSEIIAENDSKSLLKPFMRYTRKHPEYFDKSYQFGGPSSISQIKHQASKSKNTSLSKISF